MTGEDHTQKRKGDHNDCPSFGFARAWRLQLPVTVLTWMVASNCSSL